jgi:hypothetical protein
MSKRLIMTILYMIGYMTNLKFEKFNHIVPHQFVKVCLNSIFLKKNNIFIYNM